VKFDLMWASVLFAIVASAAWLRAKLVKVYLPGIDAKSMGLRMTIADDGSYIITGAGIDVSKTARLQWRWKIVATVLTCSAVLCQALRFLR
jgi:hypothetical protein